MYLQGHGYLFVSYCRCKPRWVVSVSTPLLVGKRQHNPALEQQAAKLCKMHPAHFPAQQMSLNVFCSCGPSGGPIQINLPDHLCLLDKTWHIGFYSPSAFRTLPRDFGCYHRLTINRLWQNSCPLTKPVPKPLPLKTGAVFFLNSKNEIFFRYMKISLIFIKFNESLQTVREFFTWVPLQSNIFLPSEIWIHAPVSPPPTLRRSSLFFSLFFCLLSSP